MKTFKMLMLIKIFFIFFSACNQVEHTPPSAQITLEEPQAQKEKSIAPLLALLDAQEWDAFYNKVAAGDIKALRKEFAALPPSKAMLLNYGVLLNANIIDRENAHLFKPNIKAIKNYTNIPNEYRCYMNGTLYSIANSDFFDNFLQIDHIQAEHWNNRPIKNRIIADSVIRSLREVIYELRLGQNTTPERIRKARQRHIESLTDRGDLDTVTGFYQELLDNYIIKQGELIYKDPITGQESSKFVELPKITISSTDLKEKVKNYKTSTVLSGYGQIGALTGSLSLNHDITYVDALLIMLDPWGKTVDYLSLSITQRGVTKKSLLHDPYPTKLEFDSADGKAKITYFFNGSRGTNVSRLFHSLKEAKHIGVMLYGLRINADNRAKLVAKTKANFNHMIVELWNFYRELWETHKFFGPGTFYPKERIGGEGYTDYMHYYQLHL